MVTSATPRPLATSAGRSRSRSRVWAESRSIIPGMLAFPFPSCFSVKRYSLVAGSRARISMA